MTWPSATITLYHGTTLSAAQSISNNGVDPSLLSGSTDFGIGLYATTRKLQASRWARRRSTGPNAPALLIWTTSYDALGKLHVCAFGDGGPTAEGFWDYVQFNRDQTLPHLGNRWFQLSVDPVATPYRGQVVKARQRDVSPLKIQGRLWQQREDFDQYCFHPNGGLQFLDGLQATVELVPRD